MGEITVVAYVAVTAAGLALLVAGAIGRRRLPLALGAAILLAVAGAWVVGLAGLGFGIVPLVFVRRGGGRARGVTPPGSRDA